MLRAIAVYSLNDSGNFDRLDAVEKPGTVFAPNHDLAYFEGQTLPKLKEKPNLFSGEDTFSDLADTSARYYYARFVPTTRHLHVLISDRVLREPEDYYLLVNIDNVDQKKVEKFTLKAILQNPPGYIGRDHRPKELIERIEKTKVELQNAAASVEGRGEKIKATVQLTERLFDKSVISLQNADQIRDDNSCCGGWARNPFKR